MLVRALMRLTTFLLGLILATFAIFWITNALPGDLAQVLLGVNASPNEVAELRNQLGLNRPWIVRYIDWVSGLSHGDFGISPTTHKPVAPEIFAKLAVTGWLILFGMLTALLVALPLGAFAAVNRRKNPGFIASAISQIGLSIPAFWLAILLVMLFAVRLRWLPANGYVPLNVNPVEWARHLIMPVLSLALVQGSLLSRYVRSAVIDVLNEDYFRTARSIGWSRTGALLRHGTRNVALSVITVLGLQLSTLLVGAIIIEQVFALPGLGSLLLIAVSQRDLVIVQGIVFLLVCAVLLLNLMIDLIYLIIDPRIRQRNGEE